MSEQLSLPGFGNPPPPPAKKPKIKGELEPYSLFFSIFPTPEDASALAQRAGALLEAHGLTSQPLLPHRLHVTLHDLGNYQELPQDTVDAAVRAGDSLAGDAFEVEFDCALSYPSSGTYVLSGGEGARKLTAFREELGEAMQSQGLRPKPSFTPHMTVAYDKHVIAEHAIASVRWVACEFVLIRSHRGKGIYDLLGRWALQL